MFWFIWIWLIAGIIFNIWALAGSKKQWLWTTLAFAVIFWPVGAILTIYWFIEDTYRSYHENK